jgi:hypothetical protein
MWCVGLEIITIHFFQSKLRGMRSLIPKWLFSRLEQIVKRPCPTREQLLKINRLGASVGLQKNEIVAAVDAPINSQGILQRERVSLYLAIIVVTVIFSLVILFVWNFVDQESSPITTYTPGSLYGSIRPEDFSSRSYCMQVL